MFDKIGGKVKTVASMLCWLGIAASILLAISMWILIGILLGGFLGFVVACIVGGIGCLVSWLATYLFYAFGQLVDNSDLILQHLKDGRKETEANPIFSDH